MKYRYLGLLLSLVLIAPLHAATISTVALNDAAEKISTKIKAKAKIKTKTNLRPTDYTLKFSSPRTQVSLLELYTSEGCSSCPPADRWLSRYVHDDQLWQKIVPLAFHVDYWNYLGWPDPLSKPVYSDRQRSFRQQGLSNSVYTPGFMLNGKEWRAWFVKRLVRQQAPLVFTNGGVSSPGSIEVVVRNGIIEASFPTAYNDLVFDVALLGFGISQQITRGENRGKLLKHDFVVLNHQQHPAMKTTEAQIKKSEDKKQRYRSIRVALPTASSLPALANSSSASFGVERFALAVWVHRAGLLQPLQATGSWLP